MVKMAGEGLEEAMESSQKLTKDGSDKVKVEVSKPGKNRDFAAIAYMDTFSMHLQAIYEELGSYQAVRDFCNKHVLEFTNSHVRYVIEQIDGIKTENHDDATLFNLVHRRMNRLSASSLSRMACPSPRSVTASHSGPVSRSRMAVCNRKDWTLAGWRLSTSSVR